MKRKTLFFLTVLIFLVTLSHLCIRNDKPKYTKFEKYTVQPGENLWLIADKYPHNDIREFIYEIEKYSHTTALINVGQELTIPLIERW